MGSMNPISDRAVCDGERQQEHRNRLALGAWLPALRPWDGETESLGWKAATWMLSRNG